LNNIATLKSRLGSLKIIGNSTIRQIAYEFLYAFHTASSCIISELKRDNYWSKSRFHTAPAFDGPVRASRPNIAIMFSTEKLEWWVNKVYSFRYNART